MTTKGVGAGTYTFEELEGVRVRRAGRRRGAGVKEWFPLSQESVDYESTRSLTGFPGLWVTALSFTHDFVDWATRTACTRFSPTSSCFVGGTNANRRLTKFASCVFLLNQARLTRIVRRWRRFSLALRCFLSWIWFNLIGFIVSWNAGCSVWQVRYRPPGIPLTSCLRWKFPQQRLRVTGSSVESPCSAPSTTN